MQHVQNRKANLLNGLTSPTEYHKTVTYSRPADQMGVPMIANNLVFNFYRTLQKTGLGGEANHTLVKAMESLTGLKIAEK